MSVASIGQSELTSTSESEIEGHKTTESPEAQLSTQCQCMCPCCTMSGPPNQPVDVTYSKQAYSHHSQELKKSKTYCRSLQTSWYKKYPWISVCTTRYKIFCHACRSAKKEGLLVFSKHRLNCFIEDGFGNWKNALTKLDEHEKSTEKQ